MNVNGEGTNSLPASTTLRDPPQLAASPSPDGGQLILAWPGWATNFSLWAATNLAPPALWSLVTNAALPGDPLTVTLPLEPGGGFFRLGPPP